MEISNEFVTEFLPKELLKYFRTITNALSLRTRSNQFNVVFKNVIKVVEKLVPTIWQNSQGTISLISEIVRIKHTLEINNTLPLGFTSISSCYFC